MSGSGGQGKWMASTVKEKDITELQAAGYPAKEIAHCLPAQGQVVPTPKPNERVVFILHFLRGLGFPLHPFVRWLMYYYGIDFHDLSPNSFLNISAFIVVCEALIRPFCIMLLYRYLLHYGLLLHIMSQYLCLFSLILQGLHKEGECRQLEFWAGKGANIRDLFCTDPKVLKLHESYFHNI